MALPTPNHLFQAQHIGPEAVDDPNLFLLSEIQQAIGVTSTTVSLTTSTAVSTVSAAAPDSTNLSIADSKGVSAGTRASVADSKALSGSGNTSVADSKALSVSVNTSAADSKAVSVAVATPTVTAVVYSGAISVADSKAVSTATSVAPPGAGRTITSPLTYNANNAVINVMDYLPPGQTLDGVTDTLTYINNARAQAVISGLPLVFPAGTYALSDTLNLGYQWLQVRAHGIVVFKRTGAGAGAVVAIDGGVQPLNIRRVSMQGEFRIQGTATTTKGLWVRSVADSDIECTVIDGAGIGFHVQWGVACDFKLSGSTSLTTFTNKPSVLVQVDEAAAGYYTADCNFYITGEVGLTIGLYVKSASGNNFYGTAEGLPAKGVVEDAGCNRNTFDSFWCEANTTSDFELSGGSTTLVNCNANSTSSSANVTAGGNGLIIIRGYIRWVQCTGSDSLFQGVKFDDNVAAGIKGTGTYKTVGSLKVNSSLVITSRIPDSLGSLQTARNSGNGTAHAAGDYVLSAGWGVGAFVRLGIGGTNWNGRDSGGNIVIQAAGTPAANPTVTLTFKDGSFDVIGAGTGRPVVVCSRGENSAPTTGYWAVTDTTINTAIFQFVGTPVASSNYLLSYIVMGI